MTEKKKTKENTYAFYGWQQAVCAPIKNVYTGINTPLDLYDALCQIWQADTCAPRMRQNWTEENMTMGQCSITAFLVQDIFGGEVRGIYRTPGNYHCFNAVGDHVFDLTSEQFGEEKLDYDKYETQSREHHFSRAEKVERYTLLTHRLKAYCENQKMK